MNIALFGGTFDPIHRGHLAVARAALAELKPQLEEIYFVLADLPPHKQTAALTPFAHRFHMLELALTGDERLIASRMEQRRSPNDPPNYSIDTVRKFKATLKPEDVLYLLVGIDSFLDLPNWREPEALRKECRFIVVSRPGISSPKDLADSGNPDLFLLDSVAEDVSSTQIREAVAKGGPLEDFVPSAVADYIRRHNLYS